MGIFIKKKSYFVAAFAAVILCLLMVAFSDTAVLSAKKGITLWLSSVLPAMLPFFICVNFMTGIGLIELLPVKIFPFIISVLSGYPMGAKVVGDMNRSGMIDRRQAMRLLSYCSTSGPVFMVGAVGIGMLSSKEAGFVIAASHYLGAMVNGIFFSLGMTGKTCDIPRLSRNENFELMEELTGAIFASFKSMAVILSYIIFFTFLMDIMDAAGIFDMIRSEVMKSLIKGTVEMTVGCNSLSGAEISLLAAAIWATVIISWGGLSIIGQTMSMLSGCGISFGYVIITKILHSIFAGIIALFIGKLML